MTAFSLFLNLAFLLAVHCYIVDPGPVIATKGEVWPKPQSQNSSDKYFVVLPESFQFRIVINQECPLLRNSLSRYLKIITDDYERASSRFKFDSHLAYKKQRLNDDNFGGTLTTVNVELVGTCVDSEYPSSAMDEEYGIYITESQNEIIADSIWGILRALETFSQLLYLDDDARTLKINFTTILDYPRFPHRGLLLDTSRHFIPLDKILTTLDAMSYNKMNVFHWHITDDQSFPYVSRKFPDLSDKGAYASSLVYTPSDVEEVIEYARVRGIRVLPEFDTPGHTRSWGVSKSDLLTECYEDGVKTGQLGPIDPTKNLTYEFLEEFFGEVADVFPDQYIHLGGDEVDFECWESNPDIKAFMEKINIAGNYVDLESYYIQKLINIVNQLNSNSIVWEEVFVNGVVLPNETIVHVWKESWQLTLPEVIATGRKALLSSCWYLDHIMSGGDWEKFYYCDPYSFQGHEEDRKLILGGEACMWSEVVNEYNVVSRVWPRASATAEKLWSAESVNNIMEAGRRLEEHTCRMNRRGVDAQPPNNAGYCL